ncbi:MAG TPA: DUF4492 domain-containing protein [Bacteroidales bacterium]|nr:DUF4492 domain-containing protein [Bacteroidales bacterium]
MKSSVTLISRIWRFYYDGFRNLSWWGRKMWIIIIIKLLIIFAVLKVFFFHDFLKSKFHNDKDRSEYVMDQLINSPHD